MGERNAIDNRYTAARALAAEGARCGLVTCLECGVAVFIDPADEIDALALHSRWHAREG